MIEVTRVLLVALLSLFHQFPTRSCVEQRFDRITEQAQNAENKYGVPSGILMTVAFHETHLGCDANEGGGWGAPISRFHRHVAGTPNHAANVLRRSFDVCRSWEGAINRFRCGACDCPDWEPVPHHPDQRRRTGESLYVESVLRYVGRVYHHANEPIPENLLRGSESHHQ
jgi:hypothetical protein